MERFRSHPHEALKDESEGTAVVKGKFKNIHFSHMMQLPAAYIICGSQLHSKQKANSWSCDGGIAIKNTLAFCNIVARQLDNCYGVLQDACIYTEKRDISLPSSNFEKQHSNLMDGIIVDFGQKGHYSDDLHLRKIDTFRDDHEYRMLWFVEKSEPFLDISVPEARSFCERISWDSI